MEKIEITLATEGIPLSLLITQVSEKLDSDPIEHRIRLTKFQRKKGSLHLEYEILRDTVPSPEKQNDVPPDSPIGKDIQSIDI